MTESETHSEVHVVNDWRLRGNSDTSKQLLHDNSFYHECQF